MRKGISPLLAAVILVALTISIAFIASSSISTLTQRQVSTASQQGAASSNVLEVSNIECKNQHNISFIVKNIGTSDVDGLTIAYKIENSTDTDAGQKTESVSLSNGDIKYVEINTSTPVIDGTLKYLQVCSQTPSGICVEVSNFDDADCSS